MIKEFELLGLTKGESKVYLALFELKEGTKYSIAKKAEVSPSKIYEILDKLIKKGLVSYVTKNNVKRYYPENPLKLQEYINKKKKSLDKEQQTVKELLPLLFSKLSLKETPLVVKVYEGYAGIKSVLTGIEEEFNKDYEWLAMGIRSSKKEIFNTLWIQFHQKRAKNKIKCRFLFTDKGTEFYKSLSHLKHTETRIINQLTPSGVAVYKENTFIFYYHENESACILIKNKDIAKSFAEFFNGLWKIAKP